MRRVTVLAMALCMVGTASAALLYNQAPHTPGATGGNGLSNFEGNLSGTDYVREIADDFTVPTGGWEINQVDITGIWFSAPFDLDPSRGFDVEFFNKNGAGAPEETPIYSTTSTTFVGSMTGETHFSRSTRTWLIDIPTLVLGAGSYFVAIQPKHDLNFFQLTSDPTTPIAGSEAHLRGNAVSSYPATWGPGTGVFGVPHDVAFSLHGNPVPEPASMAVLGLGLLALKRRRK